MVHLPMSSDDAAALVIKTECAWQVLGEVRYGPTDVKSRSLVFRRSI